MKTKVELLFWSAVAVDAALFTFVLGRFLHQGPGSSGGQSIGLLAYVAVPLVVLSVAVVLYMASESNIWRLIVLLLVAGPGLLIVGAQVRTAYLDYRVAQNQMGRGYFSSSTMKAMGAAVVQGDVPTLQQLGPGVNIDTVGDADGGQHMTLIGLSVTHALEQDRAGKTHSQLAVVQTLLKLGAKPDSAMDAALRMRDPSILKSLLLAGADPNQLDATRQPLVFRSLDVMPSESLRLLGEHGLNVNATAYDNSLAMEAALKNRWDLLSLLMARGADVRKPRRDGRNAAQELGIRIAELRAAGHSPAPQMLLIQAQLRQ